MTSGDLNKSSGDYLRIEICSCESLLIICTNWIRVACSVPTKALKGNVVVELGSSQQVVLDHRVLQDGRTVSSDGLLVSLTQ